MSSIGDVEKSEKIIIDELLCFIINRLNLIDPVTLVKLCEDAFDEDVIGASKDILLNNLSYVSNNDASKKRRDRGEKYVSKKSKLLCDIGFWTSFGHL